jgi:hypothetical protein
MSNFNRFKSSFLCTDDRSHGDLSLIKELFAPSVLAVISELGGQSYNDGLYRVLRADEVVEATIAAQLSFPELAKRIVVFGYDWLGRQFAADSGRLSEGAPQVLMLEVGAGEAMQIPGSPIVFHDEEVVNHPNEALAKPFFQQWQAANPAKIEHNQCVGYKVPLFLGASDTVDNLEIYDLSVYWHVCGQLRNKAMTLKQGQTIADVKIS